MSTFKEEMTASEGIYLNMKEFSAYTIESKFPNVIDGLKPIHRRILLTLHKNPHESPKEATVAGRVMEMHPHGDASIEDAIAGLAKPYANIVPLVDSDSNLGTYDGEKAAAARYVLVRHAETSEDLFFRHTEFSSLRFQACESEKGVEPTNFVPVIPTTLIMSVMGIGLGYKSDTSSISLKNLCLVTKKFITLKYKSPDTYRKSIFSLAPYLVPDFPTDCYLRNSHQIISEYRKGNFECPFVIDGVMKINKNTIVVATLPPDRPFYTIMNAFGAKIHLDKNSWEHEHFSEAKDLGDNVRVGNWVFTLRRGENPFEILTKLRKQLQFSSSWKPVPFYYDHENGMTKENPLSLLDKWSDARFRVVLGGLKQQLINLQEQYRKLVALSIVVDHAKEVCDIFCSSKDKEATVEIVAKRFNLSYFQAKYLQKLQLEKLTAHGKQELLTEIEEIKKKNSELQKKFTRIPEEMIADVDYIEKKYGDTYPPHCVVKSFIGTACYRKNGWILIESMKEFDEVLETFGPDEVTLNLFQDSGPITVLGCDDPDYDPQFDPPKYLHATYVNRLSDKHKRMMIHLKGGSAIVPEPKVYGLIDNDPVPIGNRFTVISKTEGRKIIDIDTKYIRQSANISTPSIKDVIFTSPIVDEDVFVIHCNSKIPGIVHIDRVVGDHKISRVVIGDTTVIGVYKADKPILFSIPPEIAVRTSIRNFYIQDLSKYVEPNTTIKLLLTKRRTSTDKDLTPYANRSSLFTIKE